MFTFPGTPSRTAQWFGGDPGAPQAVNGGHSLFYNRPYNTAETSDVYVVVPGAQHIPPAPPGQPAFPPHDHLVDVLPGDAGYNGFFDLKFFFDPVLIGISPPPSTFIPGSVRSVADAFQAVADGSLIGPLTPLEAHLPGIETEEDLFVLHVPATGYRPCRH